MYERIMIGCGLFVVVTLMWTVETQCYQNCFAFCLEEIVHINQYIWHSISKLYFNYIINALRIFLIYRTNFGLRVFLFCGGVPFKSIHGAKHSIRQIVI